LVAVDGSRVRRLAAMTRRVLVVVFAVAVVVVLGAGAGARRVDAGAPYSANVRAARAYARQHVNAGQWRALDVLWHKESGWAVHARTPRHASLQRTACTKLVRAAGRDALSDGVQQVIVGLRYIGSRYGTPRHARAFQRRHGYY
jgi:hypothetical protein